MRLAAFETVGLPAGPVLAIGEMHAYPQVMAREMVVPVDEKGRPSEFIKLKPFMPGGGHP